MVACALVAVAVPQMIHAAPAAHGLSVRLGPAHRGRGGLVIVPLYVDGQGTFNSIDARLQYDSSSLRMMSVRRPGAAAGTALAFNARVPGMLTIAFASAQAIATSNAAVLLVQFQQRGARAHVGTVRLLSGVVDDQ